LELFSFNLGIEAGQAIVVFVFLLVASGAALFFSVLQRDFRLVVSSGVAGIAIMLMLEKSFW